jgi:O-succinylbenzoic acid--CoA ligase
LTRLWLDPRVAPEAEALVFGSERISRGELAARADARAAGLERAGVRPGEVVAALLANTPEFVATVHALDRLGAILLPLNARLTPRELVHPLRDSGTRWLLHDASALAEQARTAACQLDRVTPIPVERISQPGARPVLRGGGLQALLYTSGTTGEPKGAWLGAEALRASAAASSRHLGSRAGSRWLACLPLFHVAGLSILLRSARDATSVILKSRFDAQAVARALGLENVTGISLVPTLLARLLEYREGRPAPQSLRCLLLGGGAAPASLLEQAVKLGYPLAPTYGLTEAASQVATARPRPGVDPLGSGLDPLPGTELRIARDDGSVAAVGETGEIQVKSATVMRGYWNRPAETARAFDRGWLRTGDLGALDERGRLRVFDRRSDLIVSGGENVYPAEIESVLCEHPGVAEAGVRGVSDAEFGSRPLAWFVPRRERAPAPGELERFCRQRLAGYKIPLRYHSVASLPRNAAGKLQRHRLEEP